MHQVLKFGGAALLAAAAITLSATSAYAVDFGDDAGQWSNDGECDDPRFAGPGMTETILLQDDILHDATDCKQAYDAGRLVLDAAVGFGDDTSTWSNDDECDDPRFAGTGMASTLLDDDRGHDATDCRTLFNKGSIALASETVEQTVSIGDVDFGSDGGSWVKDGECDDPRFTGPGASGLDDQDEVMNDATDCRQAYEAGRVTLRVIAPMPDVDLGDDASFWANNDECDDPRFAGVGMAAKTLAEDEGHEATDCRAALESGKAELRPADTAAIDFGADGGEWTNDDECDDPRFVGPGRSFVTDEGEIRNDATDCKTLFDAGRIRLR
jgi:hypothetical protein